MTVIESFNDTVAGEIRAQMARTQTTQKQLALELGWTQPYLSRRLTGRVDFTTSELEDIAGKLGVSVAELVSPRALAS